MRSQFRNLPAGLPHAFKCATRRGPYAAAATRQHRGAKFNESVAWLVCVLQVLAVSYTCTNTLWCAAKVKGVVKLRALGSTI
jgi:hypothetical protein